MENQFGYKLAFSQLKYYKGDYKMYKKEQFEKALLVPYPYCFNKEEFEFIPVDGEVDMVTGLIILDTRKNPGLGYTNPKERFSITTPQGVSAFRTSSKKAAKKAIEALRIINWQYVDWENREEIRALKEVVVFELRRVLVELPSTAIYCGNSQTKLY